MTAPNDIETRLAELLKTIQDAEQWQVGYPGNQSFDYSPLIPFLSHSLNNVGDPSTRPTTGPTPTSSSERSSSTSPNSWDWTQRTPGAT